jgi:hypothetical protein
LAIPVPFRECRLDQLHSSKKGSRMIRWRAVLGLDFDRALNLQSRFGIELEGTMSFKELIADLVARYRKRTEPRAQNRGALVGRAKP